MPTLKVSPYVALSKLCRQFKENLDAYAQGKSLRRIV